MRAVPRMELPSIKQERIWTCSFKEKKGISPEMAKALGKALSVSAEFFINLQKTYELSKAKEPSERIEKRAQLQNYPIRLMIDRGWIEDERVGDTLMEEQMLRFFEVNNANEIPHLARAAKRSSYEDIPPEQLAWLFRVRQIAREISVEKFTVAKVNSALTKLSALGNEPEQIRHVPKLLSESGIRFVIVETLPQAKIDGVCLWLDKSSPVIGMTLRYDRIDNFWFVLKHELEHVIQKHGRDVPIIDSELEGDKAGTRGSVSEEERVANAAASDFCSPQDKFNSFYLRKAPYISKKDVIAFASMNDLHPGLVVGQIHNMTKNILSLGKTTL